MKVTIHTPIGSFTSKPLTDLNRKDLLKYASAFKRGELANFTMKDENSEYFFPEKVLENSVFIIED